MVILADDGFAVERRCYVLDEQICVSAKQRRHVMVRFSLEFSPLHDVLAEAEVSCEYPGLNRRLRPIWSASLRASTGQQHRRT